MRKFAHWFSMALVAITLAGCNTCCPRPCCPPPCSPPCPPPPPPPGSNHPCASVVDEAGTTSTTYLTNLIQFAGMKPTIPPPKKGGPGAGPLARLGNKGPPVDARRAAYEDVMWALLNSSEFVFNH